MARCSLPHIIRNVFPIIFVLFSLFNTAHPTNENQPHHSDENFGTIVEEFSRGDIAENPKQADDSTKSFYSYHVTDISGKVVSLDEYRGKISLVVNVASECGYTDGHYNALVRLQNNLGYRGFFTVLAFPCNQFGAQEPGNNEDIAKFTKENYHVNFPVFGKINVKDLDVPEAWRYLIEKSGSEPNWNFWKYLVGANGEVINAWGPWVSVEDIFPEVKDAVDKAESGRPTIDGIKISHGGEL